MTPQNSGAIAEYEGKLELIAAPLNSKKFATLGSYSLVDLLKKNERYAGTQANRFGVLLAQWRESQGK